MAAWRCAADACEGTWKQGHQRTLRFARQPTRAPPALAPAQVLVVTLLKALPQLLHVVILCACVFLAYGIVGVELFAGVMRYRWAAGWAGLQPAHTKMQRAPFVEFRRVTFARLPGADLCPMSLVTLSTAAAAWWTSAAPCWAAAPAASPPCST